jgi:phosphatidylethanolamine/phosphatidyl-N-methylethanolamine N-methyltransferase
MKQAADALEARGFGTDISNAGLFFRRWLANPLQMGSVVPSSPALCRRLVQQTRYAPDEAVIELGGGTGVVSQALLKSGLPGERLYVVEIVRDMANHLRSELPTANVIEGDARRLPELIPQQWHGKIGTVIVGIPLVLLPVAEQRRFVDAIEAVAPGRGFICYTYSFASPLPFKKLGLIAKHEAWTPLNIPPASVWRYTPVSGRK